MPSLLKAYIHIFLLLLLSVLVHDDLRWQRRKVRWLIGVGDTDVNCTGCLFLSQPVDQDITPVEEVAILVDVWGGGLDGGLR